MQRLLNNAVRRLRGVKSSPTAGDQGSREERESYGLDLRTGDRHYRAWVGPPEDYDLIAALQVSLLLAAGLRETHHLADVGCGSLRAGRMLIPYLRPGRYHGVEPEKWLVEEGISKELGHDILEIKRPSFRFVSDFSLEAFGVQFDFAIAQSVFSHTYPDLLLKGLGNIANSLAPEGKLLATWHEGKSEEQGSGWIRKGVRPYTWEEIESFARRSDLSAKRLDWPHPRQSWFVACKAGSGAEETIGKLSRKLRSPRPGWGEGRKVRRKRRAAPVSHPRSDESEDAAGHEKQDSESRLPDFLIIGAQKCGTSTLYRLLAQHPYVKPSAKKEVHYFDLNFEAGLDWYLSHFPSSRSKDGRRVVVGESSPYYMAHSLAPERAARIVPQAKLIALLRNPVDRAYSHYQAAVRQGREPLEFEEAVEAEKNRLRDERARALAEEGYDPAITQHYSYLARGIYVNQLREWHKFFDREQLLVLKSEDFFSNQSDTFERVLNFLGLPQWQPDAMVARNTGGYKERMNPETRERLQAYFEPHNRRLYEYLGRDLGW